MSDLISNPTLSGLVYQIRDRLKREGKVYLPTFIADMLYLNDTEGRPRKLSEAIAYARRVLFVRETFDAFAEFASNNDPKDRPNFSANDRAIRIEELEWKFLDAIEEFTCDSEHVGETEEFRAALERKMTRAAIAAALKVHQSEEYDANEGY